MGRIAASVAVTALVIGGLVACGSGKDSDSTPPSTSTGTTTGTGTALAYLTFSVDWIDDGLDPTDTDGDFLPDIGCGDTVDILVTGGAATWEFGMTETTTMYGGTGWTGEDCFNGYGFYSFCHPISASHTLNQATSCRVQDVVPGSTTLFDASKDPFLTYFFFDTAASNCFVFGDDPIYYFALGCTQI